MSFTITDVIFLVNMPRKSNDPSQGEEETSVSYDGSVVELCVGKVQRRRFDHVLKNLEHAVGQKYVDSNGAQSLSHIFFAASA
jgi:hypothetical protein